MKPKDRIALLRIKQGIEEALQVVRRDDLGALERFLIVALEETEALLEREFELGVSDKTSLSP